MVRWAKQWRPSITWMQPRRTSSLGERACTSSPSNTIEPLVTSPRSACSRLDIAFSVVVLPAPLAPSSATMLAARHVERHALEHQDDVVVDDLDVVDAKDCVCGCGSRRSASWRCHAHSGSPRGAPHSPAASRCAMRCNILWSSPRRRDPYAVSSRMWHGRRHNRGETGYGSPPSREGRGNASTDYPHDDLSHASVRFGHGWFFDT